MYIKMSGILVSSANIKQSVRIVWQDIFDENMKVSIYLYFVIKLILSHLVKMSA